MQTMLGSVELENSAVVDRVSFLFVEAYAASSTNNTPYDIFKIPAELMSWIFALIDLPDPTSRSYSNWIEWLGFSQVCRTWRQIALANGRLWACPPLRFPRLAGEMITRSKGYPLEIDLRDEAIGSMKEAALVELLDLIFQDGKNFRVLRICHLDRHMLDQYLPRLSILPYLVELIVEIHNKSCEVSSLPLITSPHLQLLEITNLALPLPLHIQSLPHLTHLYIGACCYPHRSIICVTVSALLEFMACAPCLTKIELINALCKEKTHSISSWDTSTLTMPKLISLNIFQVEIEPVFELFSQVHLPAIDSGSQSDSGLHYSYPPRPLRSLNLWTEFHKDFPVYTTSLVAQGTDFSPLTKGTHRVGEIPNLADPTSPHMEIHIASETHPNHDFSFSRFCECIPMEDVKTLRVRGLQYNDWTILATLPAIAYVIVENRVEEFIRLTCESSQAHQRVFPRLSSIDLVDVNWMMIRQPLDEFLQGLIHHRSMGMPLETLSFENCGSIEKDLNRIRSILEQHGIQVNIGTTTVAKAGHQLRMDQWWERVHLGFMWELSKLGDMCSLQ